jgi:hypothetical protein
MEEPAVVVAKDAVTPMIAAHGKTEPAVEGRACLDIVARDDRDDAMGRLFRHEGIPLVETQWLIWASQPG